MSCRIIKVTLLIVVILVWSSQLYAGNSTYTFTLNGNPIEPIHYSLDVDSSSFRPGDVICLRSQKLRFNTLFLTLGDETICNFVTIPGEINQVDSSLASSVASMHDGRLFVETEDGDLKVACVVVGRTLVRKKVDPSSAEESANTKRRRKFSYDTIVINPLENMSPAEIKGLWGIYLQFWPEGIEKKLVHIDPNCVCIATNDYAAFKEVNSFVARSRDKLTFPSLPEKLRYLVFESCMSPGITEFSTLSRFRDLVFMIFDGSTKVPLDISLVSQNKNLRYLDLSGSKLANIGSISSLRELRFLDLSWSEGLDNVRFVDEMTHLKILVLNRTRVSSLLPLSNSGSIREIYADASMVSKLPKGRLPSLKKLKVLSSNVNNKAVKDFRRVNPQCTIYNDWTVLFARAVKGATRLRVRSGGTCHRQIDREKTLVEITDASEIERVIDNININEEKSGFHCMCCGNPTFEFYKNNKLMAMVGYHHGRSLRWAEGLWPGDGMLSSQSMDFLISWLAQQNVKGPLRIREQENKRSMERKQHWERLAQLIPRQTFTAVLNAANTSSISFKDDPLGEKRREFVAETFKKHERDAVTSAILYLRMFGCTGDRPWNEYDYYDSHLSEHLLPRFKGSDLAQAVQSVVKDEEGLGGASRWLLGEDGWRNLENSDQERILRLIADFSLGHWHSTARKKMIVALKHIASPWAIDLLRNVLVGSIERRKFDRRPETGSGWKIDFGDGDKLWSNEYSDAACAALCLAKLGDFISLPEIEKLTENSKGKDKELLEKSLKLLLERISKTDLKASFRRDVEK